jgi:hypothetical protein
LGAGVVFGPGIAIGAGIGSVVVSALAGTFGPDAAIDYVATFLLVYVAIVFWTTLGRYEMFRRGVWIALRFVIVIVQAILTAAAVSAWGAETLGRAPFATAFGNQFVGGLFGGLTFGLVALYASRRLAATDIVDPPAIDPAFSNHLSLLTATIIPAVWGAGGAVLSVSLQPLQLEYTQLIANRFGWQAANLIGLAGPSGRTLQLVLGTVSFSLILLALFGGTREVSG